MPNFIWPVPLYRLPDVERVSSEWGPRVAPVPGASTFHRGIDMGWCNGMVYVAPAGGVITHVGWNGGEGFSIHMRADDDTVMKFFHSVGGSNQVSVGDRVTQGQGLATVGDTGVSGGPHMHWEVWIGGTQNVNPRDFMNAYSLASSTATPFDNQEDDMFDQGDRDLAVATNAGVVDAVLRLYEIKQQLNVIQTAGDIVKWATTDETGGLRHMVAAGFGSNTEALKAIDAEVDKIAAAIPAPREVDIPTITATFPK